MGRAGRVLSYYEDRDRYSVEFPGSTTEETVVMALRSENLKLVDKTEVPPEAPALSGTPRQQP